MAKRAASPELDELQKRDVRAIVTVGASLGTAAKYVGCSLDDIRRAAGRDREFGKSLRQAEPGQELQHLTLIKDAAKKYWKASAWLLERKYPDRYGTRKPDTITREELDEVLSHIADIICEEVPQAKHRQNIIERMQELIAGLQAASAAQDGSDTNDSS